MDAYNIDKKMKQTEQVTKLYTDGVLRRECAAYVADPYLCDDLLQELYLILIGKDPAKMAKLIETGEIIPYIRRTIRTQLYGNRTAVSKILRKEMITLNEQIL